MATPEKDQFLTDLEAATLALHRDIFYFKSLYDDELLALQKFKNKLENDVQCLRSENSNFVHLYNQKYEETRYYKQLSAMSQEKVILLEAKNQFWESQLSTITNEFITRLTKNAALDENENKLKEGSGNGLQVENQQSLQDEIANSQQDESANSQQDESANSQQDESEKGVQVENEIRLHDESADGLQKKTEAIDGETLPTENIKNGSEREYQVSE